MTKEEIEKVIKREERYIKRRMADIEDLRYCIKATRKAIRFWEAELKKAE